MGSSCETPACASALSVRSLLSAVHPCPYLAGAAAVLEEFELARIDGTDLSALLERGYRHFGRHFFRPFCPFCSSCLPLRVPSGSFRRSRAYRRSLARNSDLTVSLARPVASEEAYRLYALHKSRFPAVGDNLSYASFAEVFFAPMECAYTLEMRLGNRLVCVAHADITDRALSAVYCYYDPALSRRGLGRYAIHRELDLAGDRRIPYVYLGYYIRDNPHMRYKADYVPNQVLLDDTTWTDFRDASGKPPPGAPPKPGFRPRCLLPAQRRTAPTTRYVSI